jgi:Zn-dependent peptidase ImmA (M78 family)
MPQQSIYGSEYERLIKYCQSRGFKVVLGNNSFADFMQKQIQIKSNLKDENKLYALLHEIGHIICSRSKYYLDKYPSYIVQFDSNTEQLKTDTAKILLLSEEFEAWHLGFLLSRKLKIKINKKNFDKIKARWLKTYIVFCWNIK